MRYKIQRYIRSPALLKRDIKEPFQRARRGYSTPDTYSFDQYLAGVIAGGVEELRDRGIGTPVGLGPDEWSQILTKISDYHKLYAICGMPLNKEDQESFKEVQLLMVEYWGALWD